MNPATQIHPKRKRGQGSKLPLFVFALFLGFAPVAFGIGLPRWLFRGAKPEPCERVVYEVVPPDGSESPAATLRDQTIDALCRRRDIFDWGKIKFEPEGDSRIVFVLPLMKEGGRKYVLHFLSSRGLRVEFRAVAPENDVWIRALLDEKRAPEHMKTVSTPDGDFWRDIRRAENPGSNGDLPRTIPPGFAERPGFEIWLEWLHLYGRPKTALSAVPIISRPTRGPHHALPTPASASSMLVSM